MTDIQLSKLLSNILHVPPQFDAPITGLALDSRFVKQGDLFFACRGAKLDGRRFIDDAVSKGARAILAEASAEQPEIYQQGAVPVFSLKDLHLQLSEIAARFYQYPAKSLQMIGVTGTNGKTSCAHFVAACLHYLNIPCGVMGTSGNGLYDQLKPSDLTTPDAITVQKTLAEFSMEGAKYAVMEVSSHSLDQGRVKAVPFTVGIFTNLTRDHLDYHGSMEAYGAAKKKLFDNELLQCAVINADDAWGYQMLESFAERKNIFAYSITQRSVLKGAVPLIFAENIQLDPGIHAHVVTPWGEGNLSSTLLGDFNLSNLLAVLTTLCLLKVPFSTALDCLSRVHSVPGRMQFFGGKNQPLVVIDYACTPDALEKALQVLRPYYPGKLYCVFGCGGERDRGKRPQMAKIAEQYADHVWVTDDNPRMEDPKQIAADILQGFVHPDRVIVQHDRSKAVRDVIQCAEAGDCVLVAGKGAETYQLIGQKKIPFCDIEKVKEALLLT